MFPWILKGENFKNFNALCIWHQLKSNWYQLTTVSEKKTLRKLFQINWRKKSIFEESYQYFDEISEVNKYLILDEEKIWYLMARNSPILIIYTQRFPPPP